MKFEEYEKMAADTDISDSVTDPSYLYYIIGLCGEVGELSEKIKKVIRDKEGYIFHDDLFSIEKEMGDVLWYLARLAAALNTNLVTIAIKNITKLQARKKRNKLHGEGDNR